MQLLERGGLSYRVAVVDSWQRILPHGSQRRVNHPPTCAGNRGYPLPGRKVSLGFRRLWLRRFLVPGWRLLPKNIVDKEILELPVSIRSSGAMMAARNIQ